MSTNRKNNPCLYCGNTLYDDKVEFNDELDKWVNVWQCTNCHTQTPRKVYKRGTHITKSQQQIIDRIYRYHQRQLSPVWKFDVEIENGKVFVSVESCDNYRIATNGHYMIGRRGKLECLHIKSRVRAI